MDQIRKENEEVESKLEQLEQKRQNCIEELRAKQIELAQMNEDHIARAIEI